MNMTLIFMKENLWGIKLEKPINLTKIVEINKKI